MEALTVQQYCWNKRVQSWRASVFEYSHSANAFVRASLWEPKFRVKERQRHKWKYQIRRSKRIETVISKYCRRPRQRQGRSCWLNECFVLVQHLWENERVMRWRPLRNDVHRANLMQTREIDEEAVVIRSNHQIAFRGREQDNRSSTDWQCNRVGAIYRQVPPLSLSFLAFPFLRGH